MSSDIELASKLGEVAAEVRGLNTRIIDFIEVTRLGIAEQRNETNKLTARVVQLETDKAVVLGKVRTLQWIVSIGGVLFSILTAIGLDKLAGLLTPMLHRS